MTNDDMTNHDVIEVERQRRNVIARSPRASTDRQTIFDAVARTDAHQCDPVSAHAHRMDGATWMASRGRSGQKITSRETR
jgi:hypothetical protein